MQRRSNIAGSGSMPIPPSLTRPTSLLTPTARNVQSGFSTTSASSVPTTSISSSSSNFPAPKRGSVFNQPDPSLASMQALLQRTIFNKQHEEIYNILQVIPRVKAPSLDVLASLSGSGPSEAEQPYFLVLTTNNQVKKSADGFGAPKLHWVKIKAPDHVGGEVSYNHKKFKLLKWLKRIDMMGSNGTSGLSGAKPNASPSSSNSNFNNKDEFTLVFRSGDTDKMYTFGLKPSKLSAPKPSDAGASDRTVFVWYCLEICRNYCGFVPTSNIDTVLYQQLTNELLAFYLSDSHPLPPYLRSFFQSVAKNRVVTAENDNKQLNKNKIEEKVIVPSMTSEETQLVQFFLNQIETAKAQQKQQIAAATPQNTTASAAGPSTIPSSSSVIHSHINDLESYLHHKLSVLERANIQSLFDPNFDRSLTHILDEEIQVNLLDGKLEEMSLWINHHNLELNKMKKGIELIEKRNMSLDIQATNQNNLFNTLHQVFDSLTLDSDPGKSEMIQNMLLHPDFSAGKVEKTLTAVKQLDHILGLEIAGGQLEDLAAIQEQRKKYAEIRLAFTQQAETALDGIFHDIAKRAVGDAQRDALDNGGLSLTSNSTVHRDLKKYADLLRYLERLEFNVFLGLRSKYTSALRSVYETKVKLYFSSLRKAVAQEHKDSHLAAFPDWSIEIARSVTRRVEAGKNVSTSSNAAIAALLKIGPNAPLPPSQQNKLLATQAFLQALANLQPACVAEEKFIREFFGMSKERDNLHPASGAGAGLSSATSSVRSLSKDAEELKVMMHDLFRGLEAELRELSSQAHKMDPFYSLDMLVHCERIMQDSQATSPTSTGSSTNKQPSKSVVSSVVSSDFMESLTTGLSIHLKSNFTSFIDGEIEWMNSQRPNPKRCGILTPLLKFPAMVDRMENIVWSSGAEGSKAGAGSLHSKRSQAADTSYQKFASALFRWLEGVAHSDAKYTDVVFMENAHFFLHLFRTPSMQVQALDQFVMKAEQGYTSHLNSYGNWNIDYEMPLITKFWNKLEEQLSNIQPEDIPFAADLSKHDLRAVVKGPLSSKILQKSLSNVLKRVEKHLPKNPLLLATVWQHISRVFLSKLARFEQLVGECYPNEKLEVSQDEVSNMMQQLMPNAQAMAAY